MTRRTIQILAAIVAVLVIVLLVLERARQSGPGERRALLPEFEANANDVTDISIRQPGADGSVTIRREGDRWVVVARDDYPADVGRLRQLIIALADADIVEQKTSNPGQYEKLQVDDPDEGGAGSKVVMNGPGFAYSVILGKTAQNDYRYARLTEEATSYLIDENPDIPESVGDWVMPDIVDIDPARVYKVRISHADGETIVIAKSDQEQTDFDVSGIPEGRELSFATIGNGIAGALAKLTLEDVRKKVEAVPASTAVYETWEGLRITAEVVSGAEDSWVAFSAEAVSEESGIGEEADRINARLGGWQYRLADYKEGLLTRHWDDILRATDTDP